MQFKEEHVINVPAAYLFKRLTNFTKFENTKDDARFSFKRQGKQAIHIGTRWDISVNVKGSNRRFVGELSEMIPPRTVSYKSVNRSFNAVLSISVISLAPEKCRVEMTVVAKSRGFASGLVFNTIRLARRRINKRIKAEFSASAARLTEEYRASL